MNNEIPYLGARFYKCALQVNPCSYTRYQGETTLQEADYNRQILQQCRDNDIEVVGLSDHGKVEDSEGLRKFLQENNITVFPGFEIASSEKIHMVCLYPKESALATLNQYLGQLMDENSTKLEQEPTHPSSLSCEQIANKVINDQHGFWYAAHMTGKNGLLKLDGGGGNYVQLWKKEALVIAGQIPGPTEDLPDTCQQIIQNNNPDYRRKKPLAIINARDIKDPETLSDPSASCFIKMTEPDFSAFKQAFFDPESRIRLNHQTPDNPYSLIRSIQWRGGGFLGIDGLAFSKNLNAVIGGRGTGKSTLIESIRYVLDLPIRGGDQRGIESLHKKNLGSSQITLEVLSKAQQGQIYRISRRYGEQPVVENQQGNLSHLTTREILPDIELLGQNEILALEKDEDAKLNLIDCFLQDSNQFDRKMNEIKRRLELSRKQIIEAHKEFERIDEVVAQEPVLDEQVKQFERLGIADKLKSAQLLEQEKTIQDRITEQFKSIEQWANNYQEIFDLFFLQRDDIDQLPNKTSVAKAKEIFQTLQNDLNLLVEKIVHRSNQAKSDYDSIHSIWETHSGKILDELNQAIAQLPDHAGKSGRALGVEYKNIVAKLATIQKNKTTHEKQKSITRDADDKRKDVLREYRDTAFARFEATSHTIEKLNKRLVGKLKIHIKRAGNLEQLESFLLDIDGIGSSKIQWLKELEGDLDLLEWAKWIKNRDKTAFMAKYKEKGLTSGTVDKLLELSLEERLQLEEIELKDSVEIQLNTAHDDADEHFVSLEDLSTGQKCTAILNLLLLSRDAPLIIDQPEENLDNAFIAERIAQELRHHKTNRQFVFATHNANIPVFGDAELIAVLKSRKDKGEIAQAGSIDKTEIREQAALILEGGREAFDMRKNKYGY